MEINEKKSSEFISNPGTPDAPVIRILGCKGKIVTDADGKRHFELECKGKKERDEVALLLEEEIVVRVNPKLVLEDEPPVEPPVA